MFPQIKVSPNHQTNRYSKSPFKKKTQAPYEILENLKSDMFEDTVFKQRNRSTLAQHSSMISPKRTRFQIDNISRNNAKMANHTQLKFHKFNRTKRNSLQQGNLPFNSINNYEKSKICLLDLQPKEFIKNINDAIDVSRFLKYKGIDIQDDQ